MRRARPWVAAVTIGYVLVLTATFLLVPSPWHYLVSSLVLLKGLIFIAVMKRAARIGQHGQAARKGAGRAPTDSPS